jgi:hypothetical protein
MPSSNLDDIDPSFLEDLRESRTAVMKAANWLSGMGIPVIVRPTFERPDPDQRAEYADDGDLEIIQRVEVKRRRLDFQDAASFPYSSIIVDVCHTFDNAKQKPYKYILFNQAMDAACIVDVAATRWQWTREERIDKGRRRSFYLCAVDACKFARID